MTDDDRALAALAAALANGAPAPPAPVARVRAHALGPLAFAHGRPEFRADFATASIFADRQRATAEEAVLALSRAGVPAALLKGISYAGWLYPDPGQRPMTDVDVLVPADAFEVAHAALRRLGYWHVGPGAQRSPRHHALTLKRRHAAIDLHRSPTQRGRVAIPMSEVWARTTAAPWVPGALRLELHDEILFHFINLARHDLIAPLLAYVDAARLLRAGAGSSRLWDRARQWRFDGVLAACVEVVEHVAGWRSAPPRWWLPCGRELLDRQLPPRAVQVGRKLLLVGGARELLAYAVAVVEGARPRR